MQPQVRPSSHPVLFFPLSICHFLIQNYSGQWSIHTECQGDIPKTSEHQPCQAIRNDQYLLSSLRSHAAQLLCGSLTI